MVKTLNGATGSRVAGWLLSTAVGVTAAAAFGAPALAEEAAADESPITVIGQRPQGERSDPRSPALLIDTPQTVQVIPSDLFEAQGARNLTDVLRNTPGITFNAGENGFSTGMANFSMRGFDASANIFVDGARDSGSFSRDAFNIEQVEVIKGPTGDNGRGAAGGYVNIVTKTPHAIASYRVNGSYGWDEHDSDDRARVTVDLNQPVSPTAAARLNLLWEDGGAPGREIAGRSSFGFAPSIAFGINTPTRFVLAYQFVEQNDTPDWGVPASLIEDSFRYNPALDADNLRHRYYGLAADYDDTQSSVALGRFERTLSPNLEFSTQVRRSSTERDSVYGAIVTLPTAGTTVTGQRQAYFRESEGLSSLTNLSARFSTGALRHNLAVGVEFSREESHALRFSTPASNFDLINPNPYRAAVVPVAQESSDVEVETAAIYLYDTIDLSPQWQLVGGVRAEEYKIALNSRNAAGAAIAGNDYETSDTLVSARLGVVYKPVEDVSLYATAGVSPLPPGNFLSNPDISRTGGNAFPGFETGLNSANARVQESINYEIGGKWEFNDRLLATAALFRTERQNVAFSGRSSMLDATSLGLQGYGEQIVQGIEVGLSGQITEQWSIFAGALFMETEREHSAQLDLYRCWAQPGDYGLANTDAGRALCDADLHGTRGEELSFAPEFSANLWTTYAFDFGLTIGGGVRYVGESWVGRPDDAERIIPNGAFGKAPDYFVIDALVSYAVNDQVDLRLNIDNVTDELYAASLNWAAHRALLGPSRSFLFTVATRF